MPSKAYQKRKRRKEQYSQNSEAKKSSVHEYYLKCKPEIIRRKLDNRKSDRAQARHHCDSVKKKIATDCNYKQTNRMRALKATRRRLEENVEYRERNRQKASINIRRRLKENSAYKEKHRQDCLVDTRRRLEQNPDYKERNRQAALLNTRRRLDVNEDYADRNRQNATKRHQRLSRNYSYMECRRRAAYERKNDYSLHCTGERQRSTKSSKTLSVRQRYWVRRSRMIAETTKRRQELKLQQKMVRESGRSSLDVKMLFRKAQRCVGQGLSKLKRLHAYMKDKASAYCDQLPQNQPATEDQFTEAVDGLRYHTSSSEPWFWDTGYNTLPADHVVAVDSSGKAYTFEPISSTSTLRRSMVNEEVDIKRWHCNTQLCKVTQDIIDGVTELMNRILTVKPSTLMTFYHELDNCENTARTCQLGHPQHCTLHDNCNSLLRPVRQLACHYPYLRTLAARLYEQRRTCVLIHAVQTARTSGSYTDLESSFRELADFLNKKLASNNSEDSAAERTCTVDEQAVLQEFHSALSTVTDMRDQYSTTACDVCEQLRTDVKRLASYEGQKGFTSEKMTAMIDMLYQRKTQVEDVDEFFQSIWICRYCADKLKADKELPRSVFNKLAVEETPACIDQLNIFETALIKHCLTSVTIVRLGQITNVCRPHNELTAAMKGRIAYLPIDVAANASFLPDKLLNMDSLVILVGGQPTKSKKIWTSLVDLRKVHAALMWLRDNNKYYANVPACTVDELQAIVTERLTSEEHEHEHRHEGKALLKKLTQASKSHLYENFSIQPLSGNLPADTLIDYQVNKVEASAENIFGDDLDVKAYPELFPTGENGMRDVSREVKILTTDFLRSRLLNKNPKFRLNMNYLFHSFQIQEISNMCHSIGHMLRTVSGRGLSAASLLDRLKSRDGELTGKLFAMMANMRGTTEYFAKLAMDIKWMVRHLGPPTLFITVSIAEWFSEPLLEYLRTVNSGKGRDVDKMTAAELCAMDPVSVNLHFHKKWHAIFSNLIKSQTTPIFGEVTDHFWRIEYQSRGAPHCHCLLWVKEAPILGRDSTEAVTAYIDKIVTCAKPDQNNSPTLHDLVTRFQTHKCNRYCLKSYRRNGQFYRKCRFGFPRPIRATTELNDVIDCLAVNQTKQARKRLYNLQRTEQETRINDYNPALLLASQSNIDVQYIGHTGSRLPYYITSYITKHERCEQDKMWEDIHSASKSLGSNAMSFAMKAVKSRQVGANEAADRLLGNKLYSKSRQMKFADLSPPEQAKRVLKPVAEVEELLKKDPTSQNIFYPHWVLDVYPDRPEQLETMSLHDFLSFYDKQRAGSKDQLQLKTLGYFLHRRTAKPYIVTHQLVNPNKSPEDENRYYYQLLKLFKPWRSESDFVVPGKSCKEIFFDEQDSYPPMAEYHKQLVNQQQSDEAVDEAIRQKRQETNVPVEREDEDGENVFEGCAVNTVEAAMQDVIDAHRNVTSRDNDSTDELSTMYNSLNTDQRRVVDKVLQQVSQNECPCRLLVSGEGGTGKSRVIHVIQRKLSEMYGETVLPVAVTAPTGLAAFNINGTTIHRLLSLPVEHGKPADYSRLQQEQLTVIRATLKDLKLLIIDEISMVSSLTLLYIHLRLTEVMTNDEAFGGISIVCFGDFLQLPPVKGNQPFESVTARETKQRLGAVSSLALWEKFGYDELTINMRQNSDAAYASLLSNVRHGHITDEEYAMLQTRSISSDHTATTQEVVQTYHRLTSQQLHPVILMPRTEQCQQVNEAILQELESDIVDVPAIDTLDTVVDEALLRKIKAAYNKVDKDITRTAGLDKCLRLCVGAKVMLKRNICVEAGLVNGAVGTVTSFDTKKADGGMQTTGINVQFSNTEGSVRIERQSSTFEVLKSIYYTRKQFPLILAFAITIHKSQGLSLKTVIADVGQNCFGSGMAYVALSRVTSLDGLHLVDLAREKIVANKSALAEYNRLRTLYAPHLPCFPTSKRKQDTDSKTTKNDSHLSATSDTAASSNGPPPKRRRCRTKSDSRDGDTTAANKQLSNRRRRKSTAAHRVRIKANNSGASRKTQQTNTNSHSSTNANNIYKYCNVASVDREFKESKCKEMNLKFYGCIASSSKHRSSIAQALKSIIYEQTGIAVTVTVSDTGGDGNCLFRALSLAISQNEGNHQIIRSYVVNHMVNSDISMDMANLFAANNNQSQSFQEHIVSMQQLGTWGTDQEIVSAAHLFDCSILCCSYYDSTGNVCIQHFPPHFASNQICSDDCHHQSIYLVNSGGHYEPAAVVCMPVQFPLQHPTNPEL